MANDALRLPAELKYKSELDALIAADGSALKPPGWRLSPKAVETYIMGNDTISAKYIGQRAIVQQAIATLASDRALMLVGEPGTAKSWLSEHLSAAISGTSALVVQGTAGTSEDHIKYGWNYALLLAEGPSKRALVPSPVFRAMENGQFARFEEVTRTASEIQDSLISILSEKQLGVPELGEVVMAKRGFNIIATANSRDRGVNEMSAALKRRFNFVTIPVVEDLEQEIAIVTKREAELRSDYQVGVQPPAELAKLLVTVFQELRKGTTKDGKVKLSQLQGTLSTAEAISILFNSGILAQHFGSGKLTGRDLSRTLIGSLGSESPQDQKALKEYNETVAKGRGAEWKDFYQGAKERLGEL